MFMDRFWTDNMMQPLCLVMVTSLLMATAGSSFVIIEEEDSASQFQRMRPCHLPSGSASYCVNQNRCKHISALLDNLQKPIPGDVALIIRDSFFCHSSADPVQVCCPLEAIQDPPINVNPRIRNRSGCSLQDGSDSTCSVYNRCSPILQLLTNLQRPLPKEIPSLMKSSLLCGFDTVGGFALPKICCPNEAVTTSTNSSSEPPPTSPKPQTDAQRFASHKNRKNLAALKDCGKVQFHDRRIINGEEATIGSYPWLANMGYTLGSRPKVEWKCGGALVGRRHVITAAHCVTNLPRSFKLAKVRIGEHRLSTKIDCQEGICSEEPQDFKVENITFHSSYNSPEVFKNDIALVRLDSPAVYNEFVQPICLPWEDDEDEVYVNTGGSTDHVAGWGATEERGRNPADALQFLNITTFDHAKCKDIYAKRQGVISKASQLCAGGDPGRDSCIGDSGSALMREVSPVDGSKPFWKFIGVVSFGPRKCGTAGVPGVYTRVRHYINWILDNVHP